MNAFSSPLESVAFDYFISDVSTIVVSNIWTWVAVFCAGAASFLWRAKSPVALMQLGPSPEPECLVASSKAEICSSLLPVFDDPKELPQQQQKPHHLILESGDRVTKGKFVTYYYPEEESENVWDDEECEFGEGHAELLRLFKVDRLETMKEMNEDGWYCCQDFSLISGDVVRLWDARLM